MIGKAGISELGSFPTVAAAPERDGDATVAAGANGGEHRRGGAVAKRRVGSKREREVGEEKPVSWQVVIGKAGINKPGGFLTVATAPESDGARPL